MKRLECLDGLRGVLAVYVMLGHMAPFAAMPAWIGHLLSHGGAAVDIFFILSGLVILRSLESQRFQARPFLIARVARIFPVFLVMFAAGIAVQPLPASLEAMPWLGSDGPVRSIWSRGWPSTWALEILAHLTMTHGLFPDGLLPDVWVRFLGAAWSLSTEWQFYVLALVVGRTRIGPERLAALFLALALTGLFWEMATPEACHFSRAFLPNKAHYFALGIASAIWVDRGGVRFFVVVLTVVLALCVAHGHVEKLLPPLLWVLCLGAQLYPFRLALVSVPLCWRLFQWLGAISYPIYLANEPIQKALGLALAWVADGNALIFTAVWLPLATLLPIAVAAWLHRHVEIPALRRMRRGDRGLKESPRLDERRAAGADLAGGLPSGRTLMPSIQSERLPQARPAREWPEQGSSRVPNWVYTDPDIFARESERIFGANDWLYTCLDAEIPNTGDFVRSQLGTREVVAVRGANGEVNVLLNSCAHRGMQFCMPNHGSAKEFVCPYHQWTYDLRGNLLGLPFRRGYRGQGGMPADFGTEAHGLRRLAVTRRNGVVFASFGAPNETLEAYLGDRMLALFDRVFDGRELVVLGYMRQRIPSNWKLMFENIKDPYHASLLHVFLVTFGLFRLDQQSAVEMDDTGRHGALISRKGAQEANDATAQMRAFKGDFALRDPRLLDPVREFPGDATVVMQTLWPNLIVQQQSNTLAMRQIVPIDVRNFDLAWTFFGYADDTPEMRQRRLRQANLMGPAGLVSLDDSEAMLLTQAGIEGNDERLGVVEMGGRGTGGEPHMVTETAIRGFYQHYRTVMGL